MRRFAPVLLLACASTKPVPSPAAEQPASRDVVTTLYEAPTDGEPDVEAYRLLGVTADGGRAYVVRRHVTKPEHWALDTIDLAHGKRIDAWETAGDRPYFNFVPLGGTLAHDVARFASIVADTGPWHGRSSGHWLEAQPAADGLIYWRDEQLVLADRAGVPRRDLDAKPNGMRVAPDRKRALWLEVALGGPTTLAISGFGATDQPRHARLRSAQHEPMWTADGTAALVLESGERMQGPTCIVRIAAHDMAKRELACRDHWTAAIAQDPTGATLALITEARDTIAIEWLDAATGAVKQRHEDAEFSLAEYDQMILDPRGRLVSIDSTWGALHVIDLASGTSTTLSAGDDAHFEGLRATRWLGDSIIVLRRKREAIEVVRVDIAALLSRPTN